MKDRRRPPPSPPSSKLVSGWHQRAGPAPVKHVTLLGRPEPESELAPPAESAPPDDTPSTPDPTTEAPP